MGEKIETQTRRGENDPQPAPKGAAYYEAVIESFKDSILEEAKGDELAINIEVLCVNAELIDDEFGEPEVDYHAFVVTTGGPHAEFRTNNKGEGYSFHYWDWYGSDKFECCTANDAETVAQVLNIYFE